jgi:hypothetical protein
MASSTFTRTWLSLLLALGRLSLVHGHDPGLLDTINVGPNYAHPLQNLDLDLPFSQPVTFAHLPWHRCFAPSHHDPLDIAIVGFPVSCFLSFFRGATIDIEPGFAMACLSL